MSADEPPQISILDARLAEIDRRLRTIQTGLADGEAGPALAIAEPAPPVADPPPPGDPPPRVEVPQATTAPGARADSDDVLDELRELAAAHARLLESLQRVVGAYERALARTEQQPPAPAPTRFSVAAGPFPSTEALRGFERTLARIPEVREVEVRGYEGEDRAIVDVHLHDPTS